MVGAALGSFGAVRRRRAVSSVGSSFVLNALHVLHVMLDVLPQPGYGHFEVVERRVGVKSKFGKSMPGRKLKEEVEDDLVMGSGQQILENWYGALETVVSISSII